jgi:hypothetical protein
MALQPTTAQQAQECPPVDLRIETGASSPAISPHRPLAVPDDARFTRNLIAYFEILVRWRLEEIAAERGAAAKEPHDDLADP